MEKSCIACGMPMNSDKDFAMGNNTKEYCVHCCTETGAMNSYEEQLISMTNYIIETQKQKRDNAEITAEKFMAMLPAWK